MRPEPVQVPDEGDELVLVQCTEERAVDLVHWPVELLEHREARPGNLTPDPPAILGAARTPTLKRLLDEPEFAAGAAAMGALVRTSIEGDSAVAKLEGLARSERVRGAA